MAKSIIVLELTNEFLSVVEVNNQRNGVELVRYSIHKLPETGVSATWIKNIWEVERFSHNRVICTLPTALVKLKSVIVPVLPGEQLQAAIQMELDTGAAGSRGGEIYKVISCHQQDQMYQVKVGVIKNFELVEHFRIFEEAGLEIIWSGTRTRGIQNFINFCPDFFDEQSEGSAYIDLTLEQSVFSVIDGEELIYRRDFNFRIADLTSSQSSEAEADFLEEIHLSVAAYKAASGNRVPTKVWLFGEVEPVANLDKQINEKLGIKLFIPERSRFTGVLTQKQTPALAPLLGLALDELGLFHQEDQRIFSLEQKKSKVNQKRILFAFGIGVLGFTLFAGIVFGIRAGLERQLKVNQWLEQKSGLINHLSSTEKVTNANLKKIQGMEEWLTGRGHELEFLLALQKNLPPGTKITDLTIASDSVKDLAGVTPSVSVLLQRIKDVPWLQNLRLKGTISLSSEGELFHLEGVINEKKVDKK